MLIKQILIFIFSICIFSVIYGQGSSDFNEKFKELINQKKYEAAFSFVEQEAELGNAEAQYKLGLCYEDGYLTKKNDSIATFWFKKSADQGWPGGEYRIAFAYIYGEGMPKNGKIGFNYMLNCAEKNDVECMFAIANFYKSGVVVQKDSIKALEWLTRLAKLKTPENLEKRNLVSSARLNLAFMYMRGLGVSKDLFISYLWYIIYNEGKEDFSVQTQQEQIEIIEKMEKQLTDDQKNEAKRKAIEILGRELTNFDMLYELNK